MELIILKTFDNAIEARIIMARLENEGIVCYLFDENIVTINPLFNQLVGGIKLKINSFDAETANQILLEIQNSPVTNEQNEIIVCPKCNSSELFIGFKSMKSLKGIISGIITILFGIFPIYYKSVYRCKVCGNEFSDKKS